MLRLSEFNKPAPRYTSYPTAATWQDLLPALYEKRLLSAPSPLSLYVHIPFCKTMCLYCGCSVVLNRKEENEKKYVDYLLQEIDLVTQKMGEKKSLSQLHFGGGTPTQLSPPLFAKITKKIREHFSLSPTSEIALEIDPRTIDFAKLRFYKEEGINRISFGVQDIDPKVQEAVRRRQSYEMTLTTFQMARELGFSGINIDLIYGLPYQTRESFQHTVQKMIEMGPDRISLFSYAQIPWLKPHQKAIAAHTLPSVEEKFLIYQEARKRFTEHGFIAIGMDHFAKESDDMALCYKEKRLSRNFQGYATLPSPEMIGIGMSAIGFISDLYAQNHKTLPLYYAALDQGLLPTTRGKILNRDDKIRKWVIHSLMCNFAVDKKAFFTLFGEDFDRYFSNVHLSKLEEQGLLFQGKEHLQATALGELLIRLIAKEFDAYIFEEKSEVYSKSI